MPLDKGLETRLAIDLLCGPPGTFFATKLTFEGYGKEHLEMRRSIFKHLSSKRYAHGSPSLAILLTARDKACSRSEDAPRKSNFGRAYTVSCPF